MLGIIVGLVSTVLGAKALFGIGMVEAISWFAALFAFGWFYVQYARLSTGPAFVATGRRLRRHVERFGPDTRGEQIVLGSASFLGVTCGPLGIETRLLGLAGLLGLRRLLRLDAVLLEVHQLREGEQDRAFLLLRHREWAP